MPNDRTPNTEHRLFVFVSVAFVGRFPTVKVVRRKFVVQQLERGYQSVEILTKRPVCGMPLKLRLEERRSRRFGYFCHPRQIVVADGFLVQAAAFGVLVMLRQGRDQFRPAFTLLGAALALGLGGGYLASRRNVFPWQRYG